MVLDNHLDSDVKGELWTVMRWDKKKNLQGSSWSKLSGCSHHNQESNPFQMKHFFFSWHLHSDFYYTEAIETIY